MRRLIVLACLGAMVAVPLAAFSGCSSFGSANDATDAGASELDAPAREASTTDAIAPTGTRFCEGKSFAVCSDFEGPTAQQANPLLADHWDRLDADAGLAIELLAPGEANHALRARIPTLGDQLGAKGALRKELAAVPSKVTFTARLQMDDDAVTQYVEPLSLQAPQDPSSFQMVVELYEGFLLLSESTIVDGGRSGSAVVDIGAMAVGKPILLEVRVVFGAAPNTAEVLVDGTSKGVVALKTFAVGKPTGSLVFSAGYPFTEGSIGRKGGSFYLDDVTLQTVP